MDFKKVFEPNLEKIVLTMLPSTLTLYSSIYVKIDFIQDNDRPLFFENS